MCREAGDAFSGSARWDAAQLLSQGRVLRPWLWDVHNVGKRILYVVFGIHGAKLSNLRCKWRMDRGGGAEKKAASEREE
jgi:hypothetical protein